MAIDFHQQVELLAAACDRLQQDNDEATREMLLRALADFRLDRSGQPESLQTLITLVQGDAAALSFRLRLSGQSIEVAMLIKSLCRRLTQLRAALSPRQE